MFIPRNFFMVLFSKKFYWLTFFFCGSIAILHTQSIDGAVLNQDRHTCVQKFKPFILPSTLIGLGTLTRSFTFSRKLDLELADLVAKSDIKKISLDDYLPYCPIVALYGLEAFGIKSRSDFKTKSLNLFCSQIVSGLSVYIIKYSTQIERPDKSNTLSFPSGHTSLAFVSAQVLVEEYGHHSIWIPISAYSVASAVGILRITNNKHWLTDVITGAGIGILSTKLVYHFNFKNKSSRV
jgi:membrane-associated phospholipid phosphatase